jgi:hypothetical protein
MAAATATADLFDISPPPHRLERPAWGSRSWFEPGKPRLSRVFLTARVNQMVSTRPPSVSFGEASKEKPRIKVNDLKTTPAGKAPQERHSV